MKNIIYFSVLIYCVLANDDLLKNFQICKRSDPNLNECLKEAIQKALSFIENGVSKFQIPSMQPIEIDAWTVKGTDVLPFEQKYRNVQLFNFATSTIDKVQATVTDDLFSICINGHMPMVKFVGQYQFEDAVFYGENLTGNGTLLYMAYESVFLVNMTGQINENGIMPTLEIKSSFHDQTIEKLEINVNHLHLEKSAQSSDHLTKNWEVIVSELSAGYSEMYAFAFQNIANSIFSQLDYNKLFPK